ncbi:DUF2752 domain-containing protein [Lunatimonas lonarensis]|nr:DUF2752 domain-containing protein [Lunatimonas lonarensis]
MRVPYDLYIWPLALVAVACIPLDAEVHASLCPVDRLGLDWCPGCGLGRSMKYLLVGDWRRSWEMHPLGGFAVLVIGLRIAEIIKLLTTQNRENGKRTQIPS